MVRPLASQARNMGSIPVLGTTYVAKRLQLAAEKRATQREKRALATVNINSHYTTTGTKPTAWIAMQIKYS